MGLQAFGLMSIFDDLEYAESKYPNGTKPCNGPLCKGKEQPFSEFGRNKNTKIKLKSKCKKCYTQDAQDYQQMLKNRTPEEIAIHQKKTAS